MQSEIYHHAEHYERMFGPGAVEFWQAQAQRYGDPILELGCGTGKLSIPLAQSGYRVTGLDLSEALVKYAQQKASEVEWVQADMRNFELNQHFKLIMLPSNNIGHLHSRGDVEACLAAVHRHLLPEGRLIIDVFVPSLPLLQRSPQERYPLANYADPAGQGRVNVSACSAYEAHTQIMRTQTLTEIPGQTPLKGQLDLKMYFPAELEALLHYNGFEIEARYGSHQQTPLQADSAYQLLVCSKRTNTAERA